MSSSIGLRAVQHATESPARQRAAVVRDASTLGVRTMVGDVQAALSVAGQTLFCLALTLLVPVLFVAVMGLSAYKGVTTFTRMRIASN